MLRHMGALGLLLLLAAGCLDPQTRAKITEEAERERDLEIRTVGDIAEVVNIGLMKVQGVGLVKGLAGTGHCPPPGDYYRTMLEQYLLKGTGARNGEITAENIHLSIRKALDDPNNALVVVTGYIPAGARRDDRFDVEIALPPASKTTSLAGGYLTLSTLRVYEAAANLSQDPMYKTSSKLLGSNVFAHAQGALVVGLGANSDGLELKRARVWQGGVSRVDRPYLFSMKQDEKSVKIANGVAERINFMYQDAPKNRDLLLDSLNKGNLSAQQKQFLLMGNATQQLNKQDSSSLTQQEVAKASRECVINVRVPYSYRLAHERFLRVATLTPLAERDPGMIRYKQRLQKMLLHPDHTVRAALRLEALGRDSIPILKTGLDSPHPFVRFAAAESLTYLGSTAGVETLAQLAEQQTLLLKNCTIALANLDENRGRDKLAELLSSKEPAVACAAFNALALHDEADPRLGGVFLNDNFWLHRVPQSPTSMVYFATSKRTQIVLLGRDIVLAPTTRLLVGKDFTVVPNGADGKFLVKRITAEGEQQRICTHRLDEILLALAEFDASYPDIVEFLRKANDYGDINCPVVNWTVPDVTLETLVREGRNLK